MRADRRPDPGDVDLEGEPGPVVARMAAAPRPSGSRSRRPRRRAGRTRGSGHRRSRARSILLLVEEVRMTPGSTEPERVPIIRPSSGVKPIEVSIGLPPWIAEAEQPLPRWQTTRRSDPGSRPRISAARRRSSVADPVEAEPADPPVVGPPPRDRHRSIDSAGGPRRTRCRRRRPAASVGQCPLRRLEPGEGGRVVERGQLGQVADVGLDRGVDPDDSLELRCRRGRSGGRRRDRGSARRAESGWPGSRRRRGRRVALRLRSGASPSLERQLGLRPACQSTEPWTDAVCASAS